MAAQEQILSFRHDGILLLIWEPSSEESGVLAHEIEAIWRQQFGKKAKVGHAALLLYKAFLCRYISFWPESTDSVVLSTAGCTHHFEQDIIHEESPPHHIILIPGDVHAVFDLHPTSRTYHGSAIGEAENCATYVRQFLRQAMTADDYRILNRGTLGSLLVTSLLDGAKILSTSLLASLPRGEQWWDTLPATVRHFFTSRGVPLSSYYSPPTDDQSETTLKAE